MLRNPTHLLPKPSLTVRLQDSLWGGHHQPSPWQVAPVGSGATQSYALRARTPQRVLAESLSGQQSLAAELAGQELADVGYFSSSIEALTKRIVQRVRDLESSLLLLPGCAEADRRNRQYGPFRSEAAFAWYVGIAPVPISSGTGEGRVRASHSGNRQTQPSTGSRWSSYGSTELAGPTTSAAATKVTPRRRPCGAWNAACVESSTTNYATTTGQDRNPEKRPWSSLADVCCCVARRPCPASGSTPFR